MFVEFVAQKRIHMERTGQLSNHPFHVFISIELSTRPLEMTRHQ